MNTPSSQPGKPPSSPANCPLETANTQISAAQISGDHPPNPIASPSSVPVCGATGAALERIGDYTILRKLGEGGMGTVYLAEDSRLGRKAAIKTIRLDVAAKPGNRARFLREARAAAAVEHDNIVPIWQVGEEANGIPFIAMPFLQGEMLESRLERQAIQPIGIILKVAREVAEGLAAAHARGLIHRDIKPANVWIEGDPTAAELVQQVRRCKILDFGLARSTETEDVHLTASGTILGTPAYMAPEQACGGKVDARSDLFSLGVMLYRMSTGRLPFNGPNMMAVLTALATVTPPSARTCNRNLPQPLSDLIDRLMSKDPAGRPQSAAEVAVAVRQIVKELQAKKSATPAAAVSPLATAGPGEGQNAPPIPLDNPTEVISASAVKPREDTAAEPKPVLGSTLKRRRKRTLPLIAVGLLALVPLGWWLATVILRSETNKGSLSVEINDPVRVPMDTKAAVKSLDPDRAAAEYVLSIGGTVRVNDEERDIKAVADLPRASFRLPVVKLAMNKQVSDMGLAHFKECKNLTVLQLDGTPVSDAGLAHLKDCKGLTYLGLNFTKVSDAGLAHFKECKNLMTLRLDGTQVSDAGLAHFKDCKGLAELQVQETKVTDAGLVYFKDCKGLQEVLLDRSQVGDAELAPLKDCKNLMRLDLSRTNVSDTGLAHLKECKNLTLLRLIGTQVSDAGLAHLKDCKGLKELNLNGTKVGDAGLAHFKGCKDLTHLFLEETKLSDAGFAHFKESKNLMWLGLSGTQVSDAGLAHLKECKNLAMLKIDKTKVTAAGIDELKKALPKCKIEWDGGVIEPREK